MGSLMGLAANGFLGTDWLYRLFIILFITLLVGGASNSSLMQSSSELLTLSKL